MGNSVAHLGRGGAGTGARGPGCR